MSDDRIERALREKGPRELGGPPMVLLPDDLREARTRLRSVERGRRFRALVGGGLGTFAAAAVVVTLVVLLLPPSPTSLAPGAGASASSSPAAATADPPVTVVATPSSAATPTPAATPVATPALALACAPADLAAVAGPWGGAAGSVGTMVTVTNTSSVPCTLSGRPGADLATASGTLVAVGGDPTSTVPQPLEPGGTLTTSLRWSNWCGSAPSGTISATLVLPAGNLAVTPDAAQPAVPVPPCNGPGQPSSLATIDFQAP